MDPQDGSEDVLDRVWEQEQRRDMEEVNRAFTKASPGCLAFLKPRTHSEQPKTLSPLPLIDQCTLWILPIQVQLACVLYFCLNITCQTHTLTHSTDLSSLPKRKKPVYGVALLWQPEVMYVYLAVVEHYSGNVETVEAAAGAIQNLTSCGWKVSF